MQNNSVILSLGSNLGNQSKQLKDAVEHLKELGDISKISSEYASEAMGFEGPDFINIVVVLETRLAPADLLQKLKQIEKTMGRVEKTSKNYTSRIIDIDIISYNKEVIVSEDLSIPHKEMEKRDFVLVPLKEVCPDWKHPVYHKSVEELLEKLDVCT